MIVSWQENDGDHGSGGPHFFWEHLLCIELWGVTVYSVAFGIHWPRFKSWLQHFPTVWPWASKSPSLCFNFPLWKLDEYQYLLHRIVMRLHNWRTLLSVVFIISYCHISSILNVHSHPTSPPPHTHTHFNIFYNQWSLRLYLILWVVVFIL